MEQLNRTILEFGQPVDYHTARHLLEKRLEGRDFFRFVLKRKSSRSCLTIIGEYVIRIHTHLLLQEQSIFKDIFQKSKFKPQYFFPKIKSRGNRKCPHQIKSKNSSKSL